MGYSINFVSNRSISILFKFSVRKNVYVLSEDWKAHASWHNGGRIKGPLNPSMEYYDDVWGFQGDY